MDALKNRSQGVELPLGRSHTHRGEERRSVDQTKAAKQMFSRVLITLKLEDEGLRDVSGRNLWANTNIISEEAATSLC